MADSQEQLVKSRNQTKAKHLAPAPPCAMVIFGATGDLTKRLVVPALYNLVSSGCLSEGFRLVGVGRQEQSAEQWHQGLLDMMRTSPDRGGEFQADRIDRTAWRWLVERMSYVPGDLNEPGAYQQIGRAPV